MRALGSTIQVAVSPLLRTTLGPSLVDQWLRLRAPNAGGSGSIPDQGAKSVHAATEIKDSEYQN